MIGLPHLLLLALTLWRAGGDYMDLGEGKCVTLNGSTPEYSYHFNRGEDCEQLCDENPDCHGFSVSEYGNCLLWEEEDLKAGGDSWGLAHCYVQHPFHVAARHDCKCTGGHCSWEPPKDCVSHFSYKGKQYTGCTTIDFGNKGWCSPHHVYDKGNWRHCVLQCPDGCFWKHPARCVPAPKRTVFCWERRDECVPNFWYKGELYEGCTLQEEQTPWCSHTFGYAMSRKWSYCKRCCNATNSTAALAPSSGSSTFHTAVASGLVGALSTGLVGLLYVHYNSGPAREISNWITNQNDEGNPDNRLNECE